MYVCSNRYEVDSPKKSAAVVGFSHKSMGRRIVGFEGQLNKCTVLCGGSYIKVPGSL